MNNNQINKSSMLRTTILFSDANATIVTTLPKFNENLVTLKSTSQQIQDIGEQQKLDVTWITKQKNLFHDQLVTLAADSAGKLTAYAQLTHNTELMGKVNITETAFKRFADGELKDYAHIIYNQAQPIVDLLADYAITATTQLALLNAINSYNAILGDPRLKKITKSQATTQLTNLFASGDAVLEDMDVAAKIVQKSQPVFYKGYLAARKIIKVGGTKLSMKIIVTEAGSDDSVKGVTVRVVSDSDHTTIFEKTTAAKGGIYVKSMPAGNYHITFSKAGYATQTVTAIVNDSETTTVSIKLVKS
jgi:hypothetical protein